MGHWNIIESFLPISKIDLVLKLELSEKAKREDHMTRRQYAHGITITFISNTTTTSTAD